MKTASYTLNEILPFSARKTTSLREKGKEKWKEREKKVKEQEGKQTGKKREWTIREKGEREKAAIG